MTVAGNPPTATSSNSKLTVTRTGPGVYDVKVPSCLSVKFAGLTVNTGGRFGTVVQAGDKWTVSIFENSTTPKDGDFVIYFYGRQH